MAKKKKTTADSILADFQTLSFDDQQALVARLPYWAISHHPVLRRKLREYEEHLERLALNDAARISLHFDNLKAKIPRHKGKAARNAIIQRLRDEKQTHGQIAKHPLVVKENGGRRMNARAVARVLRDAKRKQQ